MSRLTNITQSFDADIAAELAAKRHTENVVAEAERTYGSSRLPVEAGPFAMQDRGHPEAHTWADVSPGPEWEERCLHVAQALPEYTFSHPVWGPKGPASLSPRVEQAARDFDRIIRDYNTPRTA